MRHLPSRSAGPLHQEPQITTSESRRVNIHPNCCLPALYHEENETVWWLRGSRFPPQVPGTRGSCPPPGLRCPRPQACLPPTALLQAAPQSAQGRVRASRLPGHPAPRQSFPEQTQRVAPDKVVMGEARRLSSGAGPEPPSVCGAAVGLTEGRSWTSQNPWGRQSPRLSPSLAATLHAQSQAAGSLPQSGPPGPGLCGRRRARLPGSREGQRVVVTCQVRGGVPAAPLEMAEDPKELLFTRVTVLEM